MSDGDMSRTMPTGENLMSEQRPMTPVEFIASEIARRIARELAVFGRTNAHIERHAHAASVAVLTEWFAKVGTHTYPSGHGPDHDPWAINAWAILDQVPPGIIPQNWRFLLGGLLAGALSETYQLGKENQPPSGRSH
jgi:hypothetical protein